MALGGVLSKVNLFILNKDCATFGKGKVEVKSWKSVVNLELKTQSEAAGSMKSTRKSREKHVVTGGVLMERIQGRLLIFDVFLKNR